MFVIKTMDMLLNQVYLLMIVFVDQLFINECCCFLCFSEELGEFMESKGASSPGILTLTTSLSKPFMRLDKYPILLKELERHVEVRL